MKKPIGNKKYQTLFIETGIQRVLQVLSKYPEKEFSLSDLAKESGVAKANISVILDFLQKDDKIKIEKLSKIWRITANNTNWNFIKIKIIYNLTFVYSSGLVEFLVDYFKNPRSIILFGSFRRGEDVSSSDIDIAIESDELKQYLVTGLRELADFEKNVGRRIQIHQFNRKSVDNYLFNNITNGIVLFGFLEVNT